MMQLKNQSIKPIEWKSKRSDILILVVLYFLVVIGFIILFAFGSKHDRAYTWDKYLENLSNPICSIGAFIAAGVAYAPLFAYRYKVPKKITLDGTKGLLIIQRRYMEKEQLIALDGIGYVYYERGIFSVLEIYHTWETNRPGIFRKRFRTIMVPFWGMAINRGDLKEIVQCLKDSGGTEERLIQKRSFEDLMNN